MHKILLITLSIMYSIIMGPTPVKVKSENMAVEEDDIQF